MGHRRQGALARPIPLPVGLFDDEGAIFLIDIGTELTNLVVAQNGTPALIRFIPGRSGYLAQVVAEMADLPEEEAENQLMNPTVRIGPDAEVEDEVSGDADFDPALVYDVRRGLEDAVQTLALAEDVQRFIEHYYSQPGSREVMQAFVSGEGALVKGLAAYLGTCWGQRRGAGCRCRGFRATGPRCLMSN